MDIDIDASSLLKWAGILEGLPRANRPAIATALNQLGDGILSELAENYAAATGLDATDVRAQIQTQEARPDSLHWSADASALKLTGDDWSKPWTVNTDNTFAQPMLLSIVTSGDECVCPICEAAAENGPYTPDEIAALAAKYADYVPPQSVTGERTNLIHPNCRCVVQNFRSYRRLPVTFQKPGNAPPELLTMKQLGTKVADALNGQIKIAIRANLPK